jgi:hypothetical protein
MIDGAWGYQPYWMLDKRFPSNRWHLMYEVSSIGGGMKTAGARWADAIAIGRNSSREEFCVHGFELKENRQDLLNEIGNLEKSAPFRSICHYWWLMCPPKLIQLAEQAPMEWGIATQTSDDKFLAHREPRKNEGATIPPVFLYSALNALHRDRYEESKKTEIDTMVRLVADNDDLYHAARDRYSAKMAEYRRLMFDVKM